MTGAVGHKRVAKEFIEAYPIPLPPLPEQQRIVGILDEAFEGIAAAKAKAEANLRNARELFEATLAQHIFGDSADKGWRRSDVASLAEARKNAIRTGPFGSQLLHSEFVDDGVAVLGIDNAVENEFRWGKRRYITEKKYKELTRYTVKSGDVLITIMGTCGRCAIVPDDIPPAINSKHLCCITLDPTKCLPEFLHAYFLHHPVARAYLEENASGAIMAGLNMGLIKEMPVWLPSLSDQRDLVRQFQVVREQVQSLEAIYQQKCATLDELKNSLLHQAFSGRL